MAYQFGQAHRHPWRTKGNKSGLIQTTLHIKPGDGVLVDQIISAHPGVIPQMYGFLTNQRLWGCTNFADHVSDYVYVHLMRDLSLAETLISKEAMEKTMARFGRTVKHYHSKNGRFVENGFVDSIYKNYRKITFCEVGAQHQNVIVRRKNS